MSAGLKQFQEFKFHQTRATFGTQLMRLAMDVLPSQVDAIVFVRDAMLHKDEATTWKYVKFIEKEPIKEALSDEFFNLYT
ncbi:site-specific integrase, partial [Klebsiella pneumoniae]